MKLPRRLALAALIAVPLALLLAASRANQLRPRKLGVHPGCEFLVFSPDGKTLLSSSSRINQTLQNSNVFWNTQSGQRLRTYNSRDLDPQQLVCFSPDGKQMARIEHGFTTSKNHQLISQTIMLVSTPAGKNLNRFVLPQQHYPNYDEFMDAAMAARWSPYGKEIIVQGGRDIRRVSPQTGQVLGFFIYRENNFSEWATNSLSPDGKMLAYTETARANSHFTGARAVLVDTHTTKRTTLPIKHEMARLTFSPHSQFLAIGNGLKINFVRVRNRKHLWTWSGVSKDSFHFTADEKSVVSCNSSACVARETKTGHQLWRLKAPISPTFALSPDGKTLAEAKPNGQIWLWPLPNSS